MGVSNAGGIGSRSTTAFDIDGARAFAAGDFRPLDYGCYFVGNSSHSCFLTHTFKTYPPVLCCNMAQRVINVQP